MAKRKHPNLPNGYGSIKHLSGKRRNTWAVYPPVKEFTLSGSPVSQPALCYVDDWYKGFAVLTAYHAGTYKKGMEAEFIGADNTISNSLVDSVLKNYNILRRSANDKTDDLTFADVYQLFYDHKFNDPNGREYSVSSINLIKTCYQKCRNVYDKPFNSLRSDDLQRLVDNAGASKSSKNNMVVLLNGMYKYADERDLCQKNYASYLKIRNANKVEHGKAFTEEELKILWEHQDNEFIRCALIMCYTGFRIIEAKTAEVDLDEMFFKGGVKTEASKNRIVPIHSAILPLVEKQLQIGGIIRTSIVNYRNHFVEELGALGLSGFKPHSCRHTFSALCERYKVAENDRKRLLGHAFSNDITNGVYGHRTVEDLRKEIEKLPSRNKLCC